MKRAIVFLGIGVLQMHAIHAARSNGFYLIGFDQNADAYCKGLVDEFYNFSAVEAARIYAILAPRKDVIVEFIWANNDILVGARIWLEDQMSIKTPRLSYRDGLAAIDKGLFKRRFRSEMYVETINSKSVIIPELRYLIKPVHGSGSFGIRAMYGWQLCSHVIDKCIVEPYITGTEYGMNCFVTSNEIIWFNCVRRYFDHSKDYMPRGTIWSQEIEGLAEVKKAKLLLSNFIRVNKLIGPLKFDILISDDETVYMLEFSPRFHGEVDTSYVFHYAGGRSVPQIMFRLLASQREDLDSNLSGDGFAYGYFSLFGDPCSSDCQLNDLVKEHGLDLEVVGSLVRSVKCKGEGVSTSDIHTFLFYRSSEIISDGLFMKISNGINFRYSND